MGRVVWLITHRTGWTMHTSADGWHSWQTPTGHTFWSQRHGRRDPAQPRRPENEAALCGRGRDLWLLMASNTARHGQRITHRARRRLDRGLLVDEIGSMASLLVVTGPPGAGKSTVSSILASRAERSVLVEGDAFFRFLARGAIPPWLPESNEQNETVTRAAAAAAGQYATGGYTTVYDGVVGPWFLQTFAIATGLDELGYVILLPDVDCCLVRVATRQDHGFRDEPAGRKMHAEFERAPIDRRHVVVDPPARPEEVADLIDGRYQDGSLTYRCG